MVFHNDAPFFSSPLRFYSHTLVRPRGRAASYLTQHYVNGCLFTERKREREEPVSARIYIFVVRISDCIDGLAAAFLYLCSLSA